MAARPGFILVLAGCALAVNLAAPASAAGPECRVRNVTQQQPAGSDLGDAIDAADAGDRLRVHGICHGTVTIDKDLVIAGHVDGSPLLDADGVGTPISVSQPATVTLARLTITGSGDSGLDVGEGATVRGVRVRLTANDSGRVGGAIVNGGDLRLRRSTLSGNEAALDGGGIYNYGTLTLINTLVTGNTSAAIGGGLFNEGTAVLRDSRVTSNVATSSGGILNVSSILLRRTVVADNVPNDCDGC